MTVQFAHPSVLLLLPLVALLITFTFAVHRRGQHRLTAFVSPSMQSKLMPTSAHWRVPWQITLLGAGIFLAVIAAARPQWGQREEIVHWRGRDLVIVLDVSRSMLANDVHPNRLERAKTDIMDLIGELRGDRAALVAFRGAATLLCPLTTDYAYLRTSLDTAGTHSAPAGETDIGDAISEALQACAGDSGTHRAIILVTDGEDLAGQANAAASRSAERGIPIFAVGLGSRGGNRIPDPEGSGFITHGGSEVVTRLHHETLHQIAETTRGAYIPIETAGMTTTTLGTLYHDHLRRIAAQDFEEPVRQQFIDRFQLFLLPALLLIIAATFLSRGRLCASARIRTETQLQAPSISPSATDADPRSRESRRSAIAGMIVIMCAAHFTQGADVTKQAPGDADLPEITDLSFRKRARHAQELYAYGEYEGAAKEYQEAARAATVRSQRDFLYNAAVSCFKAGQFGAAASILHELAAVRPEAMPVLGAALYRQANNITATDATALKKQAKLLREAGEVFQQVSRRGTDDASAQRNLAICVAHWQEIETAARRAELLAEQEKTSVAGLIRHMLAEQRRIVGNILSALLANESPHQVALLEALAASQMINADLCIPLGEKLNAATSRQAPPQAAEQQQLRIQYLYDLMQAASDSLRDLDPSGYADAKQSEARIYRLWKETVSYADLLQEDLRLQTNLIDRTMEDGTELEVCAGLQREGAALTRLFVERFSAAVPDPMPGEISAELRKKILTLTGQTITAQERAAHMLTGGDRVAARPEQNLSYSLLKEIEEILPGLPAPEPQDPETGESRERDPQSDQAPEPPQAPPKTPGKPTDPREELHPAPPDWEGLSDEEVQQLLEKALQREREHEMENRRRRRSIELAPDERDW